MKFEQLKRALLVLMALCLLAGIGRADLDTSPPDPGSPLNWTLWQPGSSTPIREATLSGMGDKKPAPDATEEIDPDRTAAVDIDTLIEKVSQSTNMRVTLDPWMQSRVINVDVPIHCPWYGTDNSGGAVGHTGAQPDPIETGYKPNVSRAYRSKVLGHFVRMYVYPDAEPIPEIVNHMIEVGQASYFAVSAIVHTPDSWNNGTAHGELITRKTAKAILDSLGPVAPPLPEAEKGATEYETFLNRAILNELGNGYPHDFDPSFGSRIMDLGDDIFPKLVQAAVGHPHQLVRRNAVYMLRFYDQPEATEALRKILAGDDKVARARALVALLKRGDKVIVPRLIEAVRDEKDYFFRHFAAFALGGLGHGNDEVEKALLEWADEALKTKDDTVITEVFQTVAQALARMGVSSKGALKFYKVVQDRWGVRTHAIHQAALLGLATSGQSKNAIEEIDRFIKGRSINVFHLSMVGTALDAFHILDVKAKRSYLRSIGFQKNIDVMVRFNAMRLIDFQPEDRKQLAEFCGDRDADPIIRSMCLLKLWELDPPQAKTLAFKVLNNYVGHKNPGNLIGGDEYEVVVALQILGPYKNASYKELTGVLNQAVDVARAETKRKQQNLDERIQFVRAPVFGTAIMELARLNDPQGVLDLKKILLDREMPQRSVAARALLSMGLNENLPELQRCQIIEALVIALQDDEDAWSRCFAAKALKELTDHEYDCDWVYGAKGDIAKGIQDWKTWFTDTIRPRIEALEQNN